jgi:hypothetical protein
MSASVRDTGWENRPVEIFAETVVKIVLGQEASSAGGRMTDLHPDADLQQVVTDWAFPAGPTPASRPGGAFAVYPT